MRDSAHRENANNITTQKILNFTLFIIIILVNLFLFSCLVYGHTPLYDLIQSFYYHDIDIYLCGIGIHQKKMLVIIVLIVILHPQRLDIELYIATKIPLHSCFCRKQINAIIGAYLFLSHPSCGEWGIQTPDTHIGYTGFRVQRIRSLCQLSKTIVKLHFLSESPDSTILFFTLSLLFPLSVSSIECPSVTASFLAE